MSGNDAFANDRPSSGFNPSDLYQSTFSLLGDSFLPGNQQPRAQVASGPIAAAPGADEILVGTGESLVALNATSGALLWSLNASPSGVNYLVIDPVHDVTFAALGYELVKVGLANGTVLAHVNTESPSPIAYDPVNGLVYQSELTCFCDGMETFYGSNLTYQGSPMPANTTAFNPQAADIAVDPSTGNVFVTVVGGPGQIEPEAAGVLLSVLSPNGGTILAQSSACGPALAYPSPKGLVFDPQNGTVFVLCMNQTESFLSVQSASTARTVAQVPLPLGPALWSDDHPLVYLPQSNSVVLGNGAGGLTTVNATSYRVVENPSTALDNGANTAFAQGGPADLVYGLNPYANEVNAFAPSMTSLGFSQSLGPIPESPTVVPSRGELWVAGSPDGNSVSVVNTVVGRVVATVRVGSVPDAMAFDASHGNMWVANALSDNVSVINASTHRIVASLAVAASPVGIADIPSVGQMLVVEFHGITSTSCDLAPAVTVFNDTSFRVEQTAPIAGLPACGSPPLMSWDPGTGQVIGGVFPYTPEGSSTTDYELWGVSPAPNANSVTLVTLQGFTVDSVAYDGTTGSLYATGLPVALTSESLWKADPANGTSEGAVGNLSGYNVGFPSTPTDAARASILPLEGTSYVDVVASNDSGFRLLAFNTSSPGAPASSAPLGTFPVGAQWDPSTHSLFVANYWSASLSWFDPLPRAHVNLTSTVACGDYPEVSGVAAGPSVDVLAPGSYSLSAVGACGGSVFNSWSTSGDVSVAVASGTGSNPTVLTVVGNGTVTANYQPAPPARGSGLVSVPLLVVFLGAAVVAVAIAVVIHRRRKRPARVPSAGGPPP